MKISFLIIVGFLFIASCSTSDNTTMLILDHQRIQTFGFDNPGNLYVIKYKNITNKDILNNLIKKYKDKQPVYLKHVNGVSIHLDTNEIKKIIADFLRAGDIEYIERTPVKTLN
jgi:hypothetical protein